MKNSRYTKLSIEQTIPNNFVFVKTTLTNFLIIQIAVAGLHIKYNDMIRLNA